MRLPQKFVALLLLLLMIVGAGVSVADSRSVALAGAKPPATLAANEAEKQAAYGVARAAEAAKASAAGNRAAAEEHADRARAFAVQTQKLTDKVLSLTTRESRPAQRALRALEQAEAAAAQATKSARRSNSAPPKPDKTSRPDTTSELDTTSKPDRTSKSDATSEPDKTSEPDTTSKPPPRAVLRAPERAPNLPWLEQYRWPNCLSLFDVITLRGTTGAVDLPPVWRGPGPRLDHEDRPSCSWVDRERKRLVQEEMRRLESKIELLEPKYQPCEIEGVRYPDCSPSPCEVTDVEGLGLVALGLEKYAEANQRPKLLALARRANIALNLRDVFCQHPGSSGHRKTPTIWLAPGPFRTF